MRKRLGAIALGVFLLSLVLPALVIEHRELFSSRLHTNTMMGFQCLALGFFLWPGWLANPLLLIAWLLGALARGRPGYLAAATVVAVLAVMSAVFAAVLLDALDEPRLVTFHIGYYLWVASTLLTLIDVIMTPRTRPDAAG